MTIIDNLLDADQYFQDPQPKKQIVLHHTAGGPSAKNAIHGWNFNPEKVGTAYVIDGDGTVYKAFEPEDWAYHLGLKTDSNLKLNKESIGIEVCNWGQLIEKDGQYYNYVNKEVPANQVVQMQKFRGYEYYHEYNAAQVESLRQLVLFLADKFNIPTDYRSDMWDISTDALSGKAGIYTHVSYRKDKNDMSPQTGLITMLKGLK
jgi:N-acetyl-anhydromuramyl-L-alanine amidase AmpD